MSLRIDTAARVVIGSPDIAQVEAENTSIADYKEA
jgi:hypothetical protein